MKKLFLFAITAILSLNLLCQVHWTKHPDNPVMVPGSPGEWDEEFITPSSVIHYNNTYHMWYINGRFDSTARLGHATSSDGFNWTKNTNNPVLDLGPEGDWDDTWITGGSVLVNDSIFHLWYTGHTGTNQEREVRIGHATSPDGVTWTKDTNNPVLDLGPDGDWDDGWVYECFVLFNGSEYHMWYDGWNGTSNIVRIGHATSLDGIAWKRDSLNPIMKNFSLEWDYPLMDVSAVLFDGNTYHMWYNGGSSNNFKIGYATSEDGSVWTKYGNNPVLRKGSTGSWDSRHIQDAVVIDSSGVKYKMWYGAGSVINEGSIGYAESDTCSDIIIPVLTAEDSYYQNDSVYVTSSENGIIYLTAYANHYTLDAIREACIDSVTAIANTPVKILEQPNGNYMLYARDNRNNVSNPHKITIAVGTLESRVKSPISIYPNPAASIVNIQTGISGEYSIVIETLNGKEISSGRFNGNTHQIDLSSFQKGVYLITIRSEDFVTTRKIIKL